MNLRDTIVAVSSAPGGLRSIVRLTGPDVYAVCERVFAPYVPTESGGIQSGSVTLDADLAVDAHLYLFVAPHSYTGEPLAEIHIEAAPVLVEALVEKLLAQSLRAGGPGEFTARAYLNGKLDLTQAEAVNEIIASSNRFQLDAAERLLHGRLSQAVSAVRGQLLDCLSLIEAGLDFSGEDIVFIGTPEAVERLERIRHDLEALLAGSIRYESLIGLPAVGIAGAPNTGKSSLLNRLLGHERSIVSDQRKTTRDVLSGLWTTEHFQCVLFDCAGLLREPDNVLDRLAQQAAIEALRHCQAVIFCVDVTKPDFDEDLEIQALIEAKALLHVATKYDLTETADPTARLRQSFDVEFLPVSAQSGAGLDALQYAVEGQLTGALTEEGRDTVALTARHRQAVTDAIENVRQAAIAVGQGDDEIAAAMIRTASQGLADIEAQPIDEQILDRIFGALLYRQVERLQRRPIVL